MMFCGNCGKELDDRAVACDYCGAPVTPESAQQRSYAGRTAPRRTSAEPRRGKPEPKKKGSKKALIIILIAVIVILAGVIVFLLLRSPSITLEEVNKEYLDLLDKNYSEIVSFENSSGFGGVAYYDINDSGIPDLIYVTKSPKSEAGYQMNIAFDHSNKIVVDSIAVSECFSFCSNVSDGKYYLYSTMTNTIGNLSDVLREIGVGSGSIVATDVLKPVGGGMDILVGTADDSAVEKVLGGKVIKYRTMTVDVAKEGLGNGGSGNKDDKTPSSGEGTEAARTMVDVDSSQLPTELEHLLYRFSWRYRSDDDSEKHKEFDCTDLDNCYDSLALRIAHGFPCVWTEDYSAAGIELQRSWPSGSDPEHRFPQSGCAIMEQDSVAWVLKNIFHIADADVKAMIEEASKDSEYSYSFEKDGKSYFCTMMNGLGDSVYKVSYETVKYDGERYYIIYALVDEYKDQRRVVDRYYTEVSEVEIDGATYWTMYKHTEKIPDLTGDNADDKNDKGSSKDGSADLAAFAQFAGEYRFTSGVGMWASTMKLKEDGSFTGEYFDSNIGESGDGYDSTMYASKFSGRFLSAKKVNDYTYSFELSDIEYENEPGTSEIMEQNGRRVIYRYSKAHGLAGATTIYAYTADAPVDELPKELLSGVYVMRMDARDSDQLEYRCLYMSDLQIGWCGPKG